MIKFAALLTCSAIACSGANCPKDDTLACRLAALRTKPSIAVTCPVETPRPDCSGNSILCTPVLPEIDFDAPAVPPAPDQSEDCGTVVAPTVTPAPTQSPDVDAAPTVRPTQTPVPDQGGSDVIIDSSISAYAQEVVRLVNIERANQGLPALTLDVTLSAAAQVRAQEIDQSFSHTRPDGTSCFTVLKEFGISYRACGENIAKGSPTPARVVEGWMNSSGHRANILNENFTAIGVGVYEDTAGTLHWAQLFTA